MSGLSALKSRERSGLIRVEGPAAVGELLAHDPSAVLEVFLDEAAIAGGRLADLYQRLLAAQVRIHLVAAATVAACGDSPQGVVAVAARAAISDVFVPGDAVSGQVLVLPEVQDPGNVGTLIRIADAAGARAVFLGPGTARADSPKVIRASAGSVFHLPCVQVSDIGLALGQLRAGDWQLWASDVDGAVTLGEGDAGARLAAARVAWIMGNEAHGLDGELLAQADAVVRIPIYGGAESLNVAAAAALCLYWQPQLGMG